MTNETIHIKGNKELFNDIKLIGMRVKLLGGIIQNDFDLDKGSLELNLTMIDSIRDDLFNWEQKVRKHIYN